MSAAPRACSFGSSVGTRSALGPDDPAREKGKGAGRGARHRMTKRLNCFVPSTIVTLEGSVP